MMMSIEYINILINKDNLQWTHLYDYKVENKQFFWKEQLRIYLSRSNTSRSLSTTNNNKKEI